MPPATSTAKANTAQCPDNANSTSNAQQGSTNTSGSWQCLQITTLHDKHPKTQQCMTNTSKSQQCLLQITAVIHTTALVKTQHFSRSGGSVQSKHEVTTPHNAMPLTRQCVVLAPCNTMIASGANACYTHSTAQSARPVVPAPYQAPMHAYHPRMVPGPTCNFLSQCPLHPQHNQISSVWCLHSIRRQSMLHPQHNPISTTSPKAVELQCRLLGLPTCNLFTVNSCDADS